jgi:hypothetical protein
LYPEVLCPFPGDDLNKTSTKEKKVSDSDKTLEKFAQGEDAKRRCFYAKERKSFSERCITLRRRYFIR